MARLAQTDGLTEIQQEILSTVESFVDKEMIPVARELEHSDTYPQEIVEIPVDLLLRAARAAS
jgi:septum formation topological specificity factor MinE